jgi:hypothetical protein
LVAGGGFGGDQAVSNFRVGERKPQNRSPDYHHEPRREFSDLAEFCGVKIDGVGWPAPHFAFSGGKKDEWWLRIVGLNGPADDVCNAEVLGSADAMTQVMVQGFIKPAIDTGIDIPCIGEN